MMIMKYLLVLSIELLMIAHGQTEMRECNPKLPEYSENLCRKLQATEPYLKRYLLNDYHPDVRPVANSNGIVQVRVGLDFNELVDLTFCETGCAVCAWNSCTELLAYHTEPNRTIPEPNALSFNGFISMEWQDDFLKWDADRFNRQRSIILAANEVWIPDILFHNADESSNKLSGNVVLFNDGQVTFVKSGNFKTKCDVNLRFFPFDKHVCELVLGSWVHNSDQMDIHNKSINVNIEHFRPNSVWTMIPMGNNKSLAKYPCCPELYPSIRYKVEITRNFNNHLLSLLIPIGILTIFSLFMFLLPVQLYSRICFALFIITGFFFFILYVQTLGFSSKNLPLISIYLIVMLGVVSKALVLMVIILCLYHKGGDVPQVLRSTIVRQSGSQEDGSARSGNDWKRLAIFLNKILFILFFIAIVVCVAVFIVLFAVLPEFV